jgi:hypothetical protein
LSPGVFAHSISDFASPKASHTFSNAGSQESILGFKDVDFEGKSTSGRREM